MPEASEYARGVPCWIDLSSTDVNASKEFYTALFGWEYFVGPPETGHYTQALLGGHSVAGLMQQMPDQGETPVAWTTYLKADDAAATHKAIVEHGGRAMTEVIDVMGEGKMVIAADPTGGVFGVWEPGRHIGSRLVNEPGTWIWNELSTPDAARARAFYADVFGVEIADPMPGMDYTTFRVDGRDVGGIFTVPDAQPDWRVYFAVADTDATAAIADSKDAAVVSEPKDTPFGRMAVIQDPQGAVFALMSGPQS
ncbi:VOC family protein [Kutzneria sp. CA-103260]|uniref:VOC family protein n=1 Tax=Kutzneria sp. CA-103260 TaxID=2802641 RepID=UPI001BA9F801|nr:VOC family protein [Kutzneria sp. CA-103260]QUQ71109.1 VOC family protein [Kutzneria sp. CA-103260]